MPRRKWEKRLKRLKHDHCCWFWWNLAICRWETKSGPIVPVKHWAEERQYNHIMDMQRGEEGIRGMERVTWKLTFSSVQFSHSVVSNSLRPHESQHTRPPCPSPTPGVQSDSCPSSQLCHPAISSSVIPFSSCPQSLPASESFPMSQLFAWGSQSTGVSALASFLPLI